MKKCLILTSILMCHTAFSDNGIGTAMRVPFGYLSLHQSVSNNLVLGAFAAAVTALIANNISWHATYSQKAAAYTARLSTCIDTYNIAHITDSRLATLFSTVDFDTLIQHELWLDHSYNNWLTFWNWTASQKNALAQFNTTLMLTMYGHLIQLKNNSQADQLNIEELKNDFRLKFGLISIYPLLTAFNTMNKHYDFITTNMQNFTPKVQTLLKELLPYLKDFQVMLRQDSDYIKELSEKRTHDLQEELIHATLMARR